MLEFVSSLPEPRSYLLAPFGWMQDVSSRTVVTDANGAEVLAIFPTGLDNAARVELAILISNHLNSLAATSAVVVTGIDEAPLAQTNDWDFWSDEQPPVWLTAKHNPTNRWFRYRESVSTAGWYELSDFSLPGDELLARPLCAFEVIAIAKSLPILHP